MMTAIYIGLAGATGSMSRYLIGEWLSRVFDKSAFPIGTIAVNIIGSLLMGVVVAIFASRGELDSRIRLIVTVGFLGGFTTYSSFALETVGLLEERALSTASLYVFLTLFSGIAACCIGLALGRRI